MKENWTLCPLHLSEIGVQYQYAMEFIFKINFVQNTQGGGDHDDDIDDLNDDYEDDNDYASANTKESASSKWQYNEDGRADDNVDDQQQSQSVCLAQMEDFEDNDDDVEDDDDDDENDNYDG